MIFIFRFLKGKIKVKFYGEFYERILGFCAVNCITLWETKAQNDSITAYMTIKDFYALPQIIRGSGIRVHILEKSGLPVITNRYKKRWGILVGILIFFMFSYFMSGYIWMIEINGNQKVKDTTILKALEKTGIYEGINSKRINPKNDREKLLLELDELAWLSLNIEGSKLTVNVSETQKKPQREEKPCNLISNFDGIIKKIDLTSGNCVVKVGDTVKKGDVLVSGIIETAGMTRFVKSSGKIIAEVTQEFELSKCFEETKVLKNGNKENRYLFEFFKIKIPLFLGKVTGEFDTKSRVFSLEIFDVKLPIKLYKKTFYFKEELKIKHSEEDLKNTLKKDMDLLLKENKITNYKVKSRKFKRDKDKITLKICVTTDINIEKEEILLISSGNLNNNMVK